MLFPKEKKSAQKPGVYIIKTPVESDLITFFKNVKAGMCGIKTICDPLLAKEEYKLTVRERGIELAASCDEGLFRAVTSAYQLVFKKREIPCAEIEDKPALERRGYMLDISRGRKPSVKTLKELIDFLALLKYNEFQIYMEDICFKYPAYPQYSAGFECLTPDDIKELQSYCKERYIDLVPNQNSFGHLGAWLKIDEFAPLGLSDGKTPANTINPLDEKSFDFVKNLYSSIFPLFESEYANIGLDEAYGLGRFQTEDYCRKNGKETLFVEWLNKLNDHIKKTYNKKVMFWGDMIAKNESIYKELPKDCIALEWGYEYPDFAAMAAHAVKFRELGIDYYICPSCNTHMSFTGRCDATLFNVRTSAQIAVRHGAKGFLMTDWGTGQGEAGHPHFGIWSFVPCALAGQYAWNIEDGEKDGIGFGVDFLHAAERFTDEFMFGGKKVSKLLSKASNYYLSEPMRIPVGTMCAAIFSYPLSEPKFMGHAFDLTECETDFCFDNVISYMKTTVKQIEETDFDAQYKREALVNCKMVILASWLCKIRAAQSAEKETISSLVKLTDEILSEYRELWLLRNYEKGVEEFELSLKERRSELLNLIK